LKHTVRQGNLFSRWVPDLAFGYGYPLYNYRASVSHYLSLGLHLIGLALPRALNLVHILGISGSALGMYLLARDLFGVKAGVVAAMAYAYAPYQLLDALVRGSMPESVALALIPFVLWAFRRLALEGGRRRFLGAVVLLATLYLSHNISSLLFTPLLLAYLLMLGWVYRRRGHWVRVAVALGLALALTAFFWLPALGEKGYVQLNMARTTRNNDFHYNFLGLVEMFAPPAAVDTSLMNPAMRIHLGLVQALLGGVGLVTGLIVALGGPRNASRTAYNVNSDSVRQREVERLGNLAFFAAFAALYLFLATQASLWVWEHVPLLSFVQFPWRFVGRAALPVAVLTSASVHYATALLPTFGAEKAATYASRLLSLMLVVILVLSAMPSTYPPHGYCPRSSRATITDVFAYERQSGLVGVDPEGSYFPVWVEQRPKGSPLEEQYHRSLEGVLPRRFDETVLPEGAEVLEAEYGSDPNRARVVVESPRPFRARYLSFYFPGWRVHVDGERVAITPSDPEGLITFAVPAGRHTVHIHFGETPLRLVADAISALALLALIISVSLIPRCGLSASSGGLRSQTGDLRPAGPLLTAAFLLVFKLGVVDRLPTPFRHSQLQPDGSLPGVEHALSRSYADGLTLIGYDQSANEVPADGTLRIDLYWTVRKQPSRRYQTVIHLVGPDGFRWSRDDTFRPRDHQDPPPTHAWTPGRYALDSHEIEPLPGTPPGEYDVVLTVFDRETLAPLSVLNEQGEPTAPELALGPVRLSVPRQPADPGRLDVRYRLDAHGSAAAHLGPVTLVGADFDRDEAAPGDPLSMTTFWRAEEDPREDLAFHVALVSLHGSSVAEYTRSPVAAWHPPLSWRSGDVWRGQHRFYLPADLDTGIYTWTASLGPSTSPPISLSQLSITAPDRTFTRPAVDVETNARLGDFVTLLGANVRPEISDVEPGTCLTVTLFWRAEVETDTSYRVFLHLVGPQGALIAQSDGIPAGWTRPTTGWLVGEVISDVRTLTIPADLPTDDLCRVCRCTVYAGLYTADGGRLSTEEGADAIPVTTVPVKR
jgi:hypothetical protein